jgi:hypothetical protein
MCLLRRINQETNILRSTLKYNKNFTGVAIAVVASIILGGTILVPIQFGFAAESNKNNPRAVKGEGENATTINNFTNIINNNFNCSFSQTNELSATQEASASATQENSNNSSIVASIGQNIEESASNTIDHACSPTSASSGPEESPA